MRLPKEPHKQRSELELGLDQTAHGVQAVGILLREGLAQVVQSRGDRDVVGDLELVEEFPGVAGTLFDSVAIGFDDVGGLTNGKTEGVAFHEDVIPLEAHIPRVGVTINCFGVEPGAAVTGADGRNPAGLFRHPPGAQTPGVGLATHAGDGDAISVGIADVELVGQNFDMAALLEGEIDAAEAMTYNEYAMVLEAVNPDTGELYTADDFNVISYEEYGVGMLQDAIWADGARLASDAAYKDIAVRFVAASMLGWAHCRDDVQGCADIVLGVGPTLGASHQMWQMNEVNKLIWPSSNGVGYTDEAAWNQTVEISQQTPNLEGTTVLTAAPDAGAYTNEIVEAAWALAGAGGVDLFGEGYSPMSVTLNEGGN